MNSYKLSNLINIYNGTKYNHLNVGAIPVYGSGGIMCYVDKYLYDGEAVLLPRKGTLNNIMYTSGKIWTVDTMYYSTTNDLVLPYYLYCYLSLLDLQHLDSGSTLPSMTKSSYNNIEVQLPALDTQKKIVNIMLAIDKKIELNNKINTELEAVAKLIYDYWFVQFDFPDANGKPYKSSGGKMVYNEELKREIPDGWTNGILSDLGEVVGGSTPSTKNADNFSENGMPWITPKDLSENVGSKFISCGKQDVSDDGVKSASLKIYPKDTVLLSSRAPIGYMAIANGELTTNQGFKSFIPNKGFESSFIFYSVKNSMKTIIQYSSGSTFKEVSGSTLKTVKISLPKIETTKSYSNKMKCIFERQRLLEEKSKKLSELRDWLLPMLMNGQVTVKDS